VSRAGLAAELSRREGNCRGSVGVASMDDRVRRTISIASRARKSRREGHDLVGHLRVGSHVVHIEACVDDFAKSQQVNERVLRLH
jgi:hypothetical protein